MQADDYFFFIVDAFADGSATPHYGDATRLEVTITVRDVVLPLPPSFEKDVLPLLAAKCHDCHSGDVQEAQLDLRTLSEILRGGENGPAVVPGEPHGSLLLDLVASGQMPPAENDRLSAEEVALLRRWIKAGTPAEEKTVALPPRAQVTDADRAWWAFQPPRKAVEPAVQNEARVRTAIDRFLLSKLEQQGLAFSPDADKAALIRRAYLDLIGLPPTPAAVDAFLRDERPNAYELLIDELLQSPHYGERWGRHWLDVAGYADSEGFNEQDTERKHAWKYRDYVIQALNADKPFDEFVREQIAGDEIAVKLGLHADSPTDAEKARYAELVTATGFLRMAPDGTGTENTLLARNATIVDTLKI
ncbi:MAG: DUF1549 domain-containing protein, partial [Planctomyces sp.]